MSDLTIITPTRDRPLAFQLCERWMGRQRVQPDQWIVADSSAQPVDCTMNQEHLVMRPGLSGSHDLAQKVLASLELAKGDYVTFIEDDDWYSPDHLQDLVRYLDRGYVAAGTTRQYYYNLRHRSWVWLKNRGSCLCSTGLHAKAAHRMAQAARKAIQDGNYNIDRNFWLDLMSNGDLRYALYNHGHYVGMKGLPGSTGLGHGHRPDRRWRSDPQWSKLREWVGHEDAGVYIDLYDRYFRGDSEKSTKNSVIRRDKYRGVRYRGRV